MHLPGDFVRTLKEVRYALLDWRLFGGILVGVATTLAVRSIVSDEPDCPSLNRDTVDNVQNAGFRLRRVENVYLDVVKIIEAVKGNAA
jgi:hypothetical protein